MTEMNRRDAVKALGVLPFAGMLDVSAPSVERATRLVAELHAADDAGIAAPYKPRFFTAHEWKTVRLLADIIIPKDERSGSATDAKAPEFVDFMLGEDDTNEQTKILMRGGLAWLDNEFRHRFGTDFLGATNAQRTQVLDDIAWPTKARPEMMRGVTWFTRFRSNIGSAFYSSAMGWQDLQYMGNVFNPNWNGCPPAATDRLGVSYEAFDASIEQRRRANNL